MNVSGQDCNDWTVSLNMYEDDGPGKITDDFLGTSQVKFVGNTASNEIKFTQASYDLGKDLGDDSQEEIYFEAVVGSGSTENSLTSNSLTLKNKQFGGGGGGGGTGGGGGGGGTGKTTSVSFVIENPIQAKSLVDLAKAIGRFLLQIAIPIAVIIIIYSGLLFLTSGGNKDKVVKARTALLYAVIGLAIILIGQGFFTLIKSILDLGP